MIGFYKSKAYADRVVQEIRTNGANYDNTDGEDALVNELLNNVSASFRSGLICCVNENVLSSSTQEYSYAFLSTRNNNFSNRSQKWKVTISADPSKIAFINQGW